MDDVISGYRTVTGKSQVMPQWAMGFWQSRERYKTQLELLETLAKFRENIFPSITLFRTGLIGLLMPGVVTISTNSAFPTQRYGGFGTCHECKDYDFGLAQILYYYRTLQTV